MLDGKRNSLVSENHRARFAILKSSANGAISRGRSCQTSVSLRTFLQSAAWIDGNSKDNLQQFDNSGALTVSPFGLAAMGRLFDDYLTRFLQLRQTSLCLIRVRRVGIFFYNLPIKFREDA